MEPRSSTEYLVVHCSATKPSMDIGLREIKRWHVDDNGWRDVGYHYIIRRNGEEIQYDMKRKEKENKKK